MRFLCRVGLHKFTRREVHITEMLTGFEFMGSIIEFCECGESRLSSVEMPTTVVRPASIKEVYDL